MLLFIAIVHVFIALLLIVLVLIQDSKGGAMGMFGGGGTNTVLGTGAAGFLVKVTRWTAIIFAATCISLAYMTTQKSTSVLDDYVPAATDTQNSKPENMSPKAEGSENPVDGKSTESK